MKSKNITKRNILCIKNKEKLDLGHLLLYKPYKNIILNLHELATKIEVKDFDPVAKVYNGLLSTPKDIREYYEALLGVTSFYQHSQGGKGKYIEKKFSSSFENCATSIELDKFFLWLEFPKIYKKKGIFTFQGLSSTEKERLRDTKWNWLGRDSAEIDLGSIHRKSKTITVIEIKNRVDTGGSAARREIWTSKKFEIWIDYILNNTKIFEKQKEKYTFLELLKYFGINNFEMYIGILFDKQDSPANLDSDKKNGFYSSSKEGYNYLKRKIEKNNNCRSLISDDKNLVIKFKHNRYKSISIIVGALYGNEISKKLFRKDFSISDLLLLKYDDMWLFQLLAIEERTILLKRNKNFSTILMFIINSDYNIRAVYSRFIKSEGSFNILEKLVSDLSKKYSKKFSNNLIPEDREKENYLSDIIQFLAASES